MSNSSSTTPTRWSRHWERCQVLEAGSASDPHISPPALPAKASDGDAHQQQVIDRLKLVLNVASAGGITSWEFDLKLNRFTWHTVRQRCFGLDHVPLADYLEALRNITLEEDRHLLSDEPTRAIAENIETYSYSYRVRGKDGEIHHMRNVCKLQRNSRGKFRYIMGVTIDITQEVRASALLAERAEEKRRLLERLSMATDSANIGSWEMDLVALRFLCVENPVKSLGLPPEQYGALADFVRRVAVEDRGLLRDAIDQCIADATLRFGFRYRFMVPAHGIVHVQTYGRVVLNAQGKAVSAYGVWWDVSDEVLTHQRLQAQMQQARELSERLGIATMAAGVATFELDLVAARVLWRENSLAAWQGVMPEDGDLRPLAAHMHPDDRNALTDAIKATLRSGSDVIQYTYRIAAAGAEWAHIRNYAKVYVDGEGRAVRALGAAWDITKEVLAKEEESRRAEHERAMLHRLSVVTQAAQIVLWEFDLQTKVYQKLGGGLDSFGLRQMAPENVLTEIERLVLPEDRGAMHKATADAIAGGQEDFTCMYRVKAPEGRVHHMKNFARILRSADDTPCRIVGVTWDNSQDVAAGERLQAQMEAARELSERLSLSIRAAGVSIWEIDLVAMRFSWYENPLPATAAGLTPEGDLREYMKHCHPDDRHVMINAIKAAVHEGRDVIRYNYRIYTPEGELAYIRNEVKLYFNADQRAVRMLGVCSDITKDVAAAEKERQQAEQERALLTRFNLTTQAAGISTWEFDLKNNRFNVLGTRPAVDVLGMHSIPQDQLFEYLQRVTLPEDKDIMANAVRSAIAENQEELSFRYRGKGVDGKVHYLKNHARILRGDNGKPQLLVGVTWDYSEEVAGTERLATEVRLAQELKERLAVATLAAGISPWEIDLVAGKYLWVENSLKALSHLFKRGTLLSTFRDRIHPEDRDVFRNAAATAAKQGGDIATYRYRAFGTDGSLVHVQCYAKLFFDAANRPIRALGVSWDVTKEVVAGEQLRLQAERLVDVEQRLERASISSSEGHWEADLSSGRLWCSSSFHTLLGYIDGELEPRTSEFERLVHTDDLQAYRDALRNHLDSNQPYDLETRLLTASGEYRWIHLRGMAERDEEGTAMLLAGSIQDIHQQKLVEDALELAQLRFQRAIVGTQDGLWELDIASDQIWCSPRLALLLGYPAAQLEHNNFMRHLLHPEDSQQMLSATQAHYRDKAPFDIEVRLQTQGGEYRWFRARATAGRDGTGRALRLSGSLQDVTEARAAREQLLRATQAAEAANRAKSDFLANMSHEIRTPMNGIVGMAGLLLDTSLDPAQRDCAHTIRNSADSLLLVINDILDLSKIETGKLELLSTDFDLHALVRDVAGILGYRAAAKGLKLSVELDATVSQRVHGDAQRLRQCLMNLAGNAIKFTAAGQVAIEVRTLQDGDRLLTSFHVLDSGIGIAPEVLPRLFQPFVQADTSSTRSFGGTGLGLSIVRRLVELMGGRVTVVSEVGKGSAFSFTVALAAAVVEQPRHEVPSDQLQFSGKVLLVEDNPVNQKVATRVLQRLGLQVEAAENGVIAVERFSRALGEARYDIVFMDVQMPVMDGVSATLKIRELETLEMRRPTPICALTANALAADQERCKAAGMDDFLTKPLEVERLRDVLQRFRIGAERSEPPVKLESAVSPAPPPVNLTRFSAVTGGDAEFARELSELFIESASEQLREASSALQAPDRAQLARVAQQLKGACANIHADTLRDLAAELELNAGSLEMARLQGLLAQLTDEFQRAREFLSAMIATAGDERARSA